MPWGLCLTEVHQEQRAVRALDRIGVSTILPKYKNPWRKVRLLFPRYLFVDIVDHWREIRRTGYIARMFVSGEKPCQLPDGYMGDLLAKMTPDGIVKLETHERFTPGQRVQILRGAFKDLVAAYDGLSPKGRETVLLDFLGRKVPMEFAPSDLASA